MELQKALEHGYVLVAKDGMSEIYSNVNSDFNSKKGKEGYVIQYINGEYASMIFITKDLLEQMYNNVK
jgi:hypothetical protein